MCIKSSELVRGYSVTDTFMHPITPPPPKSLSPFSPKTSMATITVSNFPDAIDKISQTLPESPSSSKTRCSYRNLCSRKKYSAIRCSFENMFPRAVGSKSFLLALFVCLYSRSLQKDSYSWAINSRTLPAISTSSCSERVFYPSLALTLWSPVFV